MDMNIRCKKQMLGNTWSYGFPNSSKIDCFEAEWFRGKRVLDIGSHDGLLDLLLVARFAPKLLIGVEADPRLCSKAVKNMQDCINREECMDIIKRELKKNHIP